MSHPRETLLRLGAGARKSLSQNFLTSPHWATRLTDLVLEKQSDEVWEIGPGLGALTEPLVAKSKRPIRLFEYDKKLSEYLKGRFPDVSLHFGDVLEAPLQELAEKKNIAVISNLPYHLSSPILFELIALKPQVTRLVLTFQKEFAERVLGKPRSKNYGSLSVMAQTFFEISSIGTLPPQAFYPPPSVSSEALLFDPRDTQQITPHLESVVRAAFSQRRKKMSQNLKKALPNVDWVAAFAELKLSENTRAEELPKEVFAALASYVR